MSLVNMVKWSNSLWKCILFYVISLQPLLGVNLKMNDLYTELRLEKHENKTLEIQRSRPTEDYRTLFDRNVQQQGKILLRGTNLFFKYFFLEFGMTSIRPICGDLPRSNFF